MRKLLLASVAVAGATFGMTGGAKAQPVKPIAAPGTLVVHINGYLQFSIGGFGSTDNKVTTATGVYKLNTISTIGDFRIYPGFDAETRDGLWYGVQAEIRTGFSNAGVGQNGKPTTTVGTVTIVPPAGTKTPLTATTTSIASSGNDSLYVKRAYGYIGTPEAGFARFGQTDSAFTLMQNGVVETFGDGGQWTLEGGVKDLLPTAASPASTIIYADQAAVYSTDKVVYISPAIAGVSFAAGYEPNSNGLKEGYYANTSASSTSAALSSSPTAADIGTRRKNTVDGMVQYAGTTGFGAKFKVSGGALYGAPIGYTGPATAVGTALHYGYDSLEVYQAGAQATYAGLTFGGNVKGGQVEDGYVFKPKGARDALTYIVGASYVIGPYVVGASYFNAQTAGTYVPGNTAHIARTLSEYGVAVGGNYVFAKSLSLYTQYMYGHRHQPGNAGIDLSGGPGTAAKGDGQVQVIAVGATIKW